jgi:hypothetical protein
MVDRRTGVSLYCLWFVVWKWKEDVWSSEGGSDDDCQCGESNFGRSCCASRRRRGLFCLYFFVHALLYSPHQHLQSSYPIAADGFQDCADQWRPPQSHPVLFQLARQAPEGRPEARSVHALLRLWFHPRHCRHENFQDARSGPRLVPRRLVQHTSHEISTRL